MRIAFSTFGCKINQFETEEMRRSVADGNVIVPFESCADVYVINTCSVTSKSDAQCRQAIRAAFKRNSSARIIVAGCYAETRPEEIRSLPGVFQVLGNTAKKDLPNYILPDNTADRSCGVANTPTRTRGFLKIQDGCDNMCSYCIVPFARGHSRSVPEQQILMDFDKFVEEGRPEIVLSGIHIGKYGVDLNPHSSLDNLLQQLMKQRKEARIRLSSIEPNEITDTIISFLGNGLCRHLHIPLQSGDDNILKKMNRSYTSKFYASLIEKISAAVPDIAIGADVMVGFPGEGEREFENTVKLIENMPITHLHVFSYSPRPGTKAAEMDNQIPETIKKERNEHIRKIGFKKNAEFIKKLSGQVLSVVIEDKIAGGGFAGLTDNYVRVSVVGVDRDSIGSVISVRIRCEEDGSIMGYPVS